jgi:hypothetical protein
MSTSTGALKVTTGIPTRIAIGIAVAVIAAVVAVVMWTTFTGTGAAPATGSAVTTTDSVGSVPRTPDRSGGQEPAARPSTHQGTVGGEGPAQYHPLP